MLPTDGSLGIRAKKLKSRKEWKDFGQLTQKLRATNWLYFLRSGNQTHTTEAEGHRMEARSERQPVESGGS